MGYSVRSRNFRYSEWVGFEPENFKIDWSKVGGRELYNHITDPMEMENQVNNPLYERLVKKFSEILRLKFDH